MLTYDSAVEIERNEIDFMLQSLQTDLSDGKHTWMFVIKQFKIHSNVFTLLFLKTGARQGLWDSLYFAEIRNPSAGAVLFPSTSQQQKDEGEEEGKGQEGQEEEEITPVLIDRIVLYYKEEED